MPLRKIDLDLCLVHRNSSIFDLDNDVIDYETLFFHCSEILFLKKCLVRYG